MADNETIADIIAWLRRPRDGENAYLTLWRDEIADRLDAAHKREVGALRQRCTELNAEVAAKDEVIKRLNDAIAEEQKRHLATTENSSAVGNCAKLREALRLCMDEMCNRCRDLAAARGDTMPCLSGCEPVRKAKAALAEPPRNCERFRNADEALEALERHCNSSGNGCIRCPVAGSSTKEVECKIAWLFAPATEQEGCAK